MSFLSVQNSHVIRNVNGTKGHGKPPTPVLWPPPPPRYGRQVDFYFHSPSASLTIPRQGTCGPVTLLRPGWCSALWPLGFPSHGCDFKEEQLVRALGFCGQGVSWGCVPGDNRGRGQDFSALRLRAASDSSSSESVHGDSGNCLTPQDPAREDRALPPYPVHRPAQQSGERPHGKCGSSGLLSPRRSLLRLSDLAELCSRSASDSLPEPLCSLWWKALEQFCIKCLDGESQSSLESRVSLKQFMKVFPSSPSCLAQRHRWAQRGC